MGPMPPPAGGQISVGIRSRSGRIFSAAKDVEFTLNGKSWSNDRRFQTHRVDGDAILLTATIAEGKYDEEETFLHG